MVIGKLQIKYLALARPNAKRHYLKISIKEFSTTY